MTRQHLNPLRVFVAALALTVCSGLYTAQAQTPSTDDAESLSELEALYWARKDSALGTYIDADVQFMTGMIGHHAQALIMSRLAPKNGASPAVQTLAARIINAQKDEIETMQQWLRERGEPVPEVHIDGLKLMIHGLDDGGGMEGDMHGGMHGGGGMHDHTNMPGMLSDEQLQELADARDAEFDRLFLTYMIQHHSGAVIMVDDLFGVDGAAQGGATFKLASDIHVDQITEIERMKLMLRERTGTDLEP